MGFCCAAKEKKIAALKEKVNKLQTTVEALQQSLASLVEWKSQFDEQHKPADLHPSTSLKKPSGDQIKPKRKKAIKSKITVKEGSLPTLPSSQPDTKAKLSTEEPKPLPVVLSSENPIAQTRVPSPPPASVGMHSDDPGDGVWQTIRKSPRLSNISVPTRTPSPMKSTPSKSLNLDTQATPAQHSKRECSVIIYGAEEPLTVDPNEIMKHDVPLVESCVRATLATSNQEVKVRQIMRLGRRDSVIQSSRPRPIRVTFQTFDEAAAFLKNCRQIFGPDQQLGFRRDYSLRERIRWRTLKLELEARKANGEKGLVIRDGRITQRYPWQFPLIISQTVQQAVRAD